MLVVMIVGWVGALVCFIFSLACFVKEPAGARDILGGISCFFIGIGIVWILAFLSGNGYARVQSRLKNNEIYRVRAIVPKREDPTSFYLVLEKQNGAVRFFSYSSEPPSAEAEYVKVEKENWEKILRAFPSSNPSSNKSSQF